MNKRPSRPLRKIGLTLILAAPVATAQTSEAADSIETLDSVTVVADEVTGNEVSALKTGTPLIDIPQSLSVITGDEIKERGIDSIGDIVDYTPGVINSQGEGHRDAVVFRGMRSTADFFVDGVRDDVQYYRPLYNVEQVEILRGPSALTFGRGGSGGILNRTLKKAQLHETFGEIGGSINSFGGTSTNFDYNAPLSENVAFRLNIFNESLENHRDFFNGDRLGINPTLTLKLSDATKLHLSYEYADHERFIDRGIPNEDGRPASQFADTTFGDSDLNETTLEAHTLRATLEHQFSDAWKGNLNAFYGTYDKVYTNYFPSGFNPLTNEVEIDGYSDTTDRQRFSLSGDLIGEFTTGSIDHKVLIGAEYINTSSDQNRHDNFWTPGAANPGLVRSDARDQAFFPASNFRLSNGVVRDAAGGVLGTGSFSTLADDTRTTIDVYSFFIQDEISITDKLDLILGARFDSFDIEVFNVEDVTNPLVDATQSNRDQEISPRLGLVYKPMENVSLYASYSETFLPRSGEQFADINSVSDRLDADTFSNLEAGLKWNIDDNFDFTLSVFQIEATNPVASSVNPGTFDIIDTETVGFETQFKGYITDQWHISAGYSYLDGEQVNSSLDPREQPEHTFSIWNSFTVSEKFGFGLGLIYQDSSFSDNGNTVTLPSYVRVDASAYYNFENDLRLQLKVENLFDKEYFPNSHRANNITVGAPLNATVSVSKKF